MAAEGVAVLLTHSISVMLSIISKLLTFSPHLSRRVPASGFMQPHTFSGVEFTMPSPRYLEHKRNVIPGIHQIFISWDYSEGLMSHLSLLFRTALQIRG